MYKSLLLLKTLIDQAKFMRIPIPGRPNGRNPVRSFFLLFGVLLAVAVLSCGKSEGVRAGSNDDPGGPSREETPVENNTPGNPANPPTKSAGNFYRALDTALARRGMRRAEFCDANDEVARRILEDYGAIYLSAETVHVPPVCMFTEQAAVDRFQTAAGVTSGTIGGVRIELQPAAMEALRAAEEEARAQGLRIVPRGGSEAARRSYADTLRLWNSRFLPALAHWQKAGKLSQAEAGRVHDLPIREQVREVLNLEKRGLWFSKDLSKSILYSVAAPGTSQHISMLALDVTQFADARVRRILANHGWFQTVKSDQPHFTYLGQMEKDLPQLGLRQVTIGTQVFWIPDTAGN
jgi:hypothetical protein